jgi:hypothetical protein
VGKADIRPTFRFLILAAVLAVAGCATYGEGNRAALERMSVGDNKGAISVIEKNLNPVGDDRLLYHMELGLLRDLDGQYDASNRNLGQAERIAEDLFTTSVSGAALVALTNPRNGPYGGADYERVFIQYYRAINYLMLAAADPAKRVENLENARVEARKVDILLGEIANAKGSYKEVADKKAQTFSKLLDVFSKVFQGSTVDKDWVVYREDAFVRYLAGLAYEQNRDWDDARISYQKSAELLEQGYARQYGLGPAFTEQAWFDTLRMMRASGSFSAREVRELAAKKLSEARRAELDGAATDQAQIVVINEVGMVPRRGEMSLHLTQYAPTRQWILRPVISGTREEQNAKWNWFYAMYADKGILGFVGKIQDAMNGRLGTLSEKTVSLGPLWRTAETLKVPQAIGNIGVRVTIPYFDARDIAPNYGASSVAVDGGAALPMIDAESVAQLALQELLLDASDELNKAMARELLKSVLAEQTAQQAGGNNDTNKLLFSLAGKIATAATSAAETRGWITLPHMIRVQRIPVSPGAHRVRIGTDGAGAPVERAVNVKAGEIVVLHERQTKPLAVKKM